MRFCEKVFVNSSRHMRIHTNEKPYECDVCEKRFRYSHVLQRHMRIHRERPYECDVCEKVFVNSGSFEKPQATYTNENRLFVSSRRDIVNLVRGAYSHKRETVRM